MRAEASTDGQAAGVERLVLAGTALLFVVRPGAKARDVIVLMEQVTARVQDAFGVRIEPEVVVWRRNILQ